MSASSKRRAVIVAGLLAAALQGVEAQRTRNIFLGPYGWVDGDASLVALTTHRMDSDDDLIGCKFFTQSTSGIVAVDWNLTVGGTVTDTNFEISIQADNSDAPDGTPIGAVTAAFAGAAATGFFGSQDLGTPTGNLAINTPYWVVIARESGGSLSGTDYIETRITSDGRANREKARFFNSTDWTTVTANSNACTFVLEHANGTFSGWPQTAAAASSAQDDIFGDDGLGVRYKTGSKIVLQGWRAAFAKAGSPNNLEFATFVGSTLTDTCTVTAATVASLDFVECWIASPPTIAADTTFYGVLRQASDGGDGSNDYDMRTMAIDGDYVGAVLPADYRLCQFPDNDDPTSSPSCVDTEVPTMAPIILDPAAHLDEAAGGDGRIF